MFRENISEDNKETTNILNTVIGITCGLLVTLILGSYVYTWEVSKSTNAENTEWRQEHLRMLEKKFDSMEKSQEKILTAITKNDQEIHDMLHEIYVTQKRSTGLQK